ncbi:hypothetical protein DPMN_001152 [Dreissena polymorpha]|uniref:RING-type domain-containing protein n=1 Tax=Dreissena polymorpha TaxID=45954 RepID=A0A9D4RQL8_DREPO|nr:hypothetical protein DPMN_001152 [Dreissena polymorpha]
MKPWRGLLNKMYRMRELDSQSASLLSKQSHIRRGRRDHQLKTRSTDNSRSGADSISSGFKKLRDNFLTSKPVGLLKEIFQNTTEVGVSTTAHNENPNPTIPVNQLSITPRQLQEDDVIPEGQNYEQMQQLEDVSMGLSFETRSRLPRQTYEQNSQGNSDECVICGDKYQIGDVQMSLPCFDRYHEKCIDKWLQKNRQCPTCRQDVALTEYFEANHLAQAGYFEANHLVKAGYFEANHLVPTDYFGANRLVPAGNIEANHLVQADYFEANHLVPAGNLEANHLVPAGYFEANHLVPADYFEANHLVPAVFFEAKYLVAAGYFEANHLVPAGDFEANHLVPVPADYFEANHLVQADYFEAISLVPAGYL